MSGHWAYKKADEISEDPLTHGSMLVPIILGSDKTTVSVATGNQEFHPLYLSIGNIDNEMQQAHREGLVPVAFLAIPKTAREYEDDEEFRLFKKQVYHQSIAKILAPLRPGMTTPEVMRCPDGHYRWAIFQLGPYIADYLEQVFLSGIVQGWCPKCRVPPSNLEKAGLPQFRDHTDTLIETFDLGELWDAFGVVSDVIPFTDYFPHADIHQLITPDLLHQLIKGTFKDHLVAWVVEYVETHAASKHEAKQILDEIDWRIAAVPAFPGLRRFPEGRGYKQWTGNDSKVLMKVFLPAIVGFVPDKMVHCIAAFLDFCYLARWSAHDTLCLQEMNQTLESFHEFRSIFQETGIQPKGFSLPRQHALVHYVENIRLFSSPNGLCSSITESKHIPTVKRPWQQSNRNNPIGQIIRMNTRLSKLAAVRVEFGRRGMLQGDIISHVRRVVGLLKDDDSDGEDDPEHPHDGALTDLLDIPDLPNMIWRFIHDQLYLDDHLAAENIPLDHCPVFHGRISVYHSATATFYAPSELSG
ncbi:hypothetical protein JAAARDRAFT_86873, partial [Jaapia argillacea MUCL 33604]